MGYDTLIEGQGSEWNGRDWARAKQASYIYINKLQVLSYNMKLNPFKSIDLTTHERKG